MWLGEVTYVAEDGTAADCWRLSLISERVVLFEHYGLLEHYRLQCYMLLRAGV